MSRDYINNNYIESARVYLKLGEPNEIIIKCCMCNTVGLTDWLLFLSHLKTSHAADQWQEQRAPNLDTEVQAEVELELQNLKEMNSVDKHTNVETDTDESVFEEKSLNVKVEGVVQDVLIFEEPEAEVGQRI